MEKILLTKLDPKAKEHQRKKVLRIFFSWNARQVRPDESETKFWNWVKNLSPDNLNSTERFKSMSYEFLDKLISKKLFRDSLAYWISSVYLPTLTKSTEDEQTQHFLQFILNCVNIKESIEAVKEKYLEEFPEVINDHGRIIRVVEFPNDPGLYTEFRCSKNTCCYYKNKHLGFIGVNMHIECISMLQSLKCIQCGNKINISSIGVSYCKYLIKGCTLDSDLEPIKDMTSFYSTIDELHFFEWTEMKLTVIQLIEAEKTFLENVVISSFSDPSVPKKKYCKRKNPEVEKELDTNIATSVVALEKEIRELDSQIYELVADSYKNSLLIGELQAYIDNPLSIEDKKN